MSVNDDVIRESTDAGIVIEIPRQFLQYSYICTIGTASSSVVVLIADRHGDKFAAKFVSREGLLSDGRLQYFEREVRLLEFLRHPNLVRLLEVAYLPNSIVLITEYCECGDIFEYLLHRGALRPGVVRSFLFQILKAIEYLHEKGYAHRDLKPENIFVDRNATVKVGDLGLAHASTRDQMLTTICGTTYYAAPEVLQRKAYDGCKADIWAIGILAYVLALGSLPWQSADIVGIVAEITSGIVILPSDFPTELAQFVRLCTALDPAARPTPSQLLSLHWIADEQPAYDKLFGRGARLSGVGQAGRAVVAAAKPSKFLLTKPIIRPFNSENLRVTRSFATIGEFG
jgi:serine/threonine protein kinase